MNSFTRIIKFGIVGASGVVVNHGMLILLRLVSTLPLAVRSPLAIETAIITNFLLNYFWTWNDRKSNEKGHKQLTFLKFNLSSALVAFLFNYIPLLLFVNMLNWNEDISNITGIILAAGVNFLISHFWTFTNDKSDQ